VVAAVMVVQVERRVLQPKALQAELAELQTMVAAVAVLVKLAQTTEVQVSQEQVAMAYPQV
tara:strand:+ start:36 stop:218 length:183 start_codon:yes stop_codon:yes gene_type:complete